MASGNFVQTSFAGGEWSPYSQGRYDHPKYRQSMAVCENGFPLTTGAWTRRPGTKFAAFTRGGLPGRTIPFAFENADPYSVELTDGHVRFYQGQSLLATDFSLVTNISTAIPAVVTVDVIPVGWAAGDSFYFTFNDPASAAGLPLLANRQFVANAVSSTTLDLYDAITGDPVDGSQITWSAAYSVQVGKITDLASPYTGDLWQSVRAVQNEDDVLLLRANVPPQMLHGEKLGDSPASFDLDPAKFIDGPYLDPFEDSYMTPDATTGLVNFTLSNPTYDATKAYSIGDYVTSGGSSYVSLVDDNLNNTPASNPDEWQPASAGDAIALGGFSASDIGRHVRLFSEPPLWATGTTYAIGDVVSFGGQYWAALVAMTGAAAPTGTINPNQPGNKSTTWALNPTAARWTWGKVTGFPNVNVIDPSAAGTVFSNFSARDTNAFDGNTTGIFDNSAYRYNPEAASPSYARLGKAFSAPTAFSSVVLYPTTDFAFGTNYSRTVILRAANSTPNASNATTLGVELGRVTFQGNSTSAQTITSNDQTTTYTNLWIVTYQTDNNETFCLSEMRMFGAGAPAGSLVTVRIIGDPLLYTNTIRVWRIGLFGGADTVYPVCGCYHEGRMWLSGAVANRFDASMSNDPLVFSPTGPTGAVAGNNAISYTFNASDRNAIYWMIPDLQGIVAGTPGGEWLIDSPSTASAGFSPTNIRARRVTKYKSANVEPERTGLTTVFVQRYSRQLLEFLADAYSGKFVGPELTEFNRQAVEPGIEELAYQQGLVPVIWTRLSDGTLSGSTYRRTAMLSTQPPELLGWHRHELGSGRLVDSIAAGPSVTPGLDTLTMVTHDPAGGPYQVEFLTDVFSEHGLVTDAWHVDGGVVPSSAVSITGGVRFYGLWPHNGKTVAVWAAGIDCGDFLVTNGYVDVPYSGLFTQRWLTQLAAQNLAYDAQEVWLDNTVRIPAVVGFSFTSRGQLLRPVAQDMTGAQVGPAFAKLRRDHKLGVQFQNAQGVKAGLSFDGLRTLNFKTKGGRLYSAAELYSGVFWDSIDSEYDVDSQLCWTITRPYPATITAIGGFMQTQD